MSSVARGTVDCKVSALRWATERWSIDDFWLELVSESWVIARASGGNGFMYNDLGPGLDEIQWFWEFGNGMIRKRLILKGVLTDKEEAGRYLLQSLVFCFPTL